LTDSIDTNDWFEFSGLLGGSSYSLSATYTIMNSEAGFSAFVYNSSMVQLGAGSLEGSGSVFAGTLPGDGELIVNLSGNPFSRTVGYDINLTAALGGTPEPSTFAGTALALAGALAWRRKRKK
jgi:hypothetical protein